MSVAADQLIEQADTCRTPGLVAASTVLYSGALVFTNASGYLDDDTASGVNKFTGIACTRFDNSGGSNGDVKAECFNEGVFKLTGSGFDQASVGKPVYATDNYTLTLTPTSATVLVGIIREYISSTVVMVELITDFARQAAYTQTYATADKTQANLTVGTDIAAFTDPPSAAEMALLRTFVNALKADLTDVKQITNSIIDDLQAVGLVG